MADSIKHQGIVENIDGSHVKVRIIQTSACSTCSIKGHCSSADTKEKLIDVENYYSYPLAIGQEVWVVGKMYMGAMAVIYAFVIPFLIVFVSLFLMRSLSGSDLWAALISLLLLVPYYFLLHSFDKELGKKFTFILQPMN